MWPQLPPAKSQVFFRQNSQPAVPQPQASSSVVRNDLVPNQDKGNLRITTPNHQEMNRPAKRSKEDYMKSPQKDTFATPEEETVSRFKDSQYWVCIRLKEGGVKRFTWSIFGE